MKCHRHEEILCVKIHHSGAENREGSICSGCADCLYIHPLFSIGTVYATDWKLLEVYGKLKGSIARELHIKYM